LTGQKNFTGLPFAVGGRPVKHFKAGELFSENFGTALKIGG
jgi:hypothetical protein